MIVLHDILNKTIDFSLQGENIKLNAPKEVLTPEIVDWIKQHKQDIIEYLKNDAVTNVPIGENKRFYPLSSAQLKLFLIQQLNPSSTNYNIPQIFEFASEPDVARLEHAFNKLIERNENLRTSFTIDDGEMVQRILDNLSISIPEFQIADNELSQLLNDFVKPFDLEQSPLIRLAIVRTKNEKSYLLWDMHHIISDGVTNDILLHDLIKLHNGEPIEPVKLQYKDFSEWQNNIFFHSLNFHKQLAFWYEQIYQDFNALNWPLDKVRSDKIETSGDHLNFTIPETLTKKLIEIAGEFQTTLNTIFFAIYSIYIGKFCDQNQFFLGTLVAGRQHPDLNNIAGSFANYLPVYININEEYSFIDHLLNCRERLINVYSNQDVPFEKILELNNSNKKLAKNRNPLFDTMLVFHNETDEDILRNQYLFKSIQFFENHGAKLDLKMDVYKNTLDECSCTLEYNTSLFHKDSMLEFIEYFKKFIALILENKNKDTNKLEIFPETIQKKFKQKQQLNYKDKGENKNNRLVIASSFTDASLQESINWWGEQYDSKIDIQFSSYNQIVQELTNENSLFNTNNKGINVILLRFEDWLKNFKGSDVEQINFLEENYKQLIFILSNIESEIPYIFGVFPVSDNVSSEVKDCIHTLTKAYNEFIEKGSKFYCVDFRQFEQHYLIQNIYDNISFNEAHIPFTDEAYAAIGTHIFRKVISILKPNPYKVIVLDCDNTLWEGVCGELGAENVIIDEYYISLQKLLLEKLQQGFILALCSKNNEKDVWDVFDQHPKMVLKREHIAAYRINWVKKSDNLKDLAKELNLGIDSFIFLDDNIAECHEVMHNCPEVFTLQVPSDKKAIPQFIEHNWAFDKNQITDEDAKRNQMYQAESKRKASLQQSVSLEDYLKELNLEVSCCFTKKDEIPRVAQLSQRTNQFNLSTIRYTEDEIAKIVANDTKQSWSVHVRDKFGDYGLTGVVVTSEIENQLILESFMLSCRVLGRGVEDAVVYAIKRYAGEKQLTEVQANFSRTNKNEPIYKYLNSKWRLIASEREKVLFGLTIEDENDAPNHIKAHYQEKLPIIEVKVNKPESIISQTEPELNSNKTFNMVSWEINLANKDKLLHLTDYLPLQYYSAKSILNQIKKTEKLIPDYSDVEKALLDIKNIQNAIVCKNGIIKAYYTANGMVSSMKIRKSIKDRIQNTELLPKEYIKINSFPKLSNGEIDKAKFIASLTGQTNQQVPTTEVEKTIAQIWQDVLNIEKVSLQDNFFDLGGNSLMIIKVISKMYTAFQEKPEFSDFLNQNLAKFAAAFEQKLSKKEVLQTQNS